MGLLAQGYVFFLPPYVFTRGDSRIYSCALLTRLRHCATTAVTCTSVTGIYQPGQRTCTKAICARPITGRVGWVDGKNSVPTGIAVCVIENREFRGLGKAGYGSVQALMLRAVRCAWVQGSNPRDPLGQMYYGSLKYWRDALRFALVSTLIA